MLEYKEIISKSLAPIYGEGEANSMALYYLDALRALGINKTQGEFEEDIFELKSGVPVQYVVGLSFFYGYEFYLNNKVLIPRAETEELVYWAVSENKHNKNVSVLDIGSGSGCILLSTLLEVEESKGEAWDISPNAIECIESNISKYNLNARANVVDVLNYDWEKHESNFDIIFCNPPYILDTEKSRMGKNVLEHEPHIALFVDGNDPLIFYKTIIDNLGHVFNPLGAAYFETSDLYHEELDKYLRESGLNYTFKRDMQGAWRMLKVSLGTE